MASSFTNQDLKKLMHLARIQCTEEEACKLYTNLSRVLSYIEQLQTVNTEGVEPCSYVIETFHTVWREDETGDLLEREAFLKNAPAHVGSMVRVPPVIQF